MTDQATQAEGRVSLQIEASEYTVAPGSSIAIPLVLINQGASVDFYELSVIGIPSPWVSFPPVSRLSPGQRYEATLVVKPPAAPEGRIGIYPFLIRAISQQTPSDRAEVSLNLTLAALAAPGRIGVLMDATRFSVAPGESIELTLTLVNQGLMEDHLSVTVEGLPAGWVSIPMPVNRLAAGEQRETYLTIRPPLSPQSKAGRNPFKIRIASRQSPTDASVVSCTLTIAAFANFNCELRPQVIDAGQQSVVNVTNLGNAPDTYTISWETQGDDLNFEALLPPEQSTQTASGRPRQNWEYEPVGIYKLRVAPGETQVVEYQARPRAPMVVGGETRYPFAVQVQSSSNISRTLNGEAIAKGLLPTWAIPVGLLTVLLMACAASLFFIWMQWGGGDKVATATLPVAFTQTTGTPEFVQTIGAQLTATANQDISLTQTVVAGQTQSAFETAAATAALQDNDGDGLTNNEEANLGTDPNNPDTDGDRLSDGQEVKVYSTDPRNPDSDRDELRDGDEVQVYGSDPKQFDTDGDELSDGEEILRRKTDARNIDTDGDGLTDGEEVLRRQTDPLHPDTDRDRVNDGAEVRTGTDPLRPDTDNDRLLDGQESPPCPNPLNPDSDGDGMIDGLDPDPCNPFNPSLTATAIGNVTPTYPFPLLSPTPPFPFVTPTYPFITPAQPTPQGTSPAPPPVQGTLVFESNRDGAPGLYRMNASNLVTARLSSPTLVDTQPAYSPDGSRIAFVSSRDGNNEIYVMNADGSNAVNLTNNPADDLHPAWSPDGKYIVFSTNRDGNREIYTMKADGSELHNMTNHAADDFEPTWFKNKGLFISLGEWIVFTSTRDNNQEIYRMKPDGTGLVNLTNSQANDHSPAGEPNGSRILFVSERNGNPDIFVIDYDGKNLKELTNNPAPDLQPAWKPDGSWVVFTSWRDGNGEIYVMKDNGSQPYNMSNNYWEDQYASWY